MRTLEAFAGAGGAALGLRAAGCHAIVCVEADADCVATLTAAGFPAVRAGIGGPYAIRKGRAGRVVETIPAFDPSPYIGIDMVWSSPPCQPYSRAGSGLGAADPRDGWIGALSVLSTVRPTWAVVENVSGAPVATWSADMAALGYIVSAWTLDAADYGVPQNRIREFVIAGPVTVGKPRATHYGPKVPPFARIGMVPWRTMEDALPGLRFFGGGANPRHPGGERTERDLTNSPSTTIAGPYGNCYPFVISGDFLRPHTPRPVSLSSPSVTGAGNCYLYDAPAPCITATDGVALGSAAARDKFEQRTGKRALTWREAATLQDFPDDYPFSGGSRRKYLSVGNAVPPTLARVIGEAVMRANGALR